jgi:hypothetical protein
VNVVVSQINKLFDMDQTNGESIYMKQLKSLQTTEIKTTKEKVKQDNVISFSV